MSHSQAGSHCVARYCLLWFSLFFFFANPGFARTLETRASEPSFPVDITMAPKLDLPLETVQGNFSSSLPESPSAILAQQTSQEQQKSPGRLDPKDPNHNPFCEDCSVDAQGNPIPLDRQQPHRLLGFMPNFRSVAAGTKPPPPTWANNFKVATRQSFDYSSFIFLGLTSLIAEWENEHPVFGKGVPGFYSYTWRGLLDKTDGTYLSAFLLPSLLREDTRFYPLGSGHPVLIRELYVISRQGVARTYHGRQTPNIAGLGGKVLTQVISRTYYPSSASHFSVLATKFGYAAMRDVMFTNLREFYPDVAAHYIRKHRAKVAAQAARDARDSGVPASH